MATTPLQTSPDSYWQVLGVAEYRNLFVAQTISMVGTVMAGLALAVTVFQRTGSPFLSSLTFALGFVPHLVGGLALSGLADRVSPRRLMVSCDLVRAGIFAAMAIPGVPVWGLLSMLFGAGLISPLFSGAQSSILPEVLGDGNGYVLGRSLIRIMGQTSQISSYAIGGVLLLVLTPSALLLADAVTFVLSAILIRVGTASRPGRTVVPGSDELTRGLRTLLAEPRIRRVITFQAIVPAFAVVPEALAIPYLADLGFPAGSAGLLLWAMPLGIVIGDLLCAQFLDEGVRRRLLVPMAAAIPLVQLGFIARPGLVVAAALLLVSGLGFAHTLALDAVLLDSLPVHQLGQGLALASSLTMFTQGVGFAAAGAMAEIVPAWSAIVVGAITGLEVITWLGQGLRPGSDNGGR